jgi:hypothetical protein
MKFIKLFIFGGIILSVVVWVAVGWKKTNGYCHEAPVGLGCINLWEKTGKDVDQNDPCHKLLLCIRKSNLVCYYWGTDEYSTCEKDYEVKKLQAFIPVVMTVETTGGLCSEGRVCGSQVVIRGDGSVTYENQNKPAVMLVSDVQQLKKLVTKANIDQLKTKKFTGTCPTASDGQEIVYKFILNKNEESIDSCEYEIPQDNPLIQQVNLILEKAGK